MDITEPTQGLEGFYESLTLLRNLRFPNFAHNSSIQTKANKHMNSKPKFFKLIATFLALAAIYSAAPVSAADQQTVEPTATEQATSMTDGEIKKVDKDAGKLTIKHGPLVNLGMLGMTMVFGVKDAAVLETLKTGDKVKFVAAKVDGRIVVTEISVQM